MSGFVGRFIRVDVVSSRDGLSFLGSCVVTRGFDLGIVNQCAHGLKFSIN